MGCEAPHSNIMRGVTECQTNEPGSAETNQIPIVVNGERRLVGTGLTLRTLLGVLGVDPTRVAIELDRKIVKQPDWEGTAILAGAELEIVQFVGGG